MVMVSIMVLVLMANCMKSSDIIKWSEIGEGIGVTIAPGIEILFDQGHVLVKAEKIHRFKVKRRCQLFLKSKKHETTGD